MELEVFPVVVGALIGFAVHRLAPARLRVGLLVALSIVAGVLSSAPAGELEISLGFIFVDVGQVVLVACLAYGLDTVLQGRASTVR